MKNKKIGNEIKWYKPFALVKRNKVLEKLTEEQFLIINNYQDEINALKEEIKNLKENLTLEPEKPKTRRTKKTTLKKEEKKVPAKRGRPKKKEDK